jgi:hypothetical protein
MIPRGRDLLEVARDRDLLNVATNPDPERERKIADEKLCLRLLAGYSVDDGKLGFPPSGSAEEWAARAALARVIRDHMKGFTGEFLALAIDPRTPSAAPLSTRPIRFIRFDKPRGRSPTIMRDLLVVGFIRRQRHKLGKEDAALLAAEREFRLGKSRTHAIWAEYKERVGESRRANGKARSGARRVRHSTK